MREIGIHLENIIIRMIQSPLKAMNIAHEKIVKVIKEHNNALNTEFSLVEELDSYLKSIKPEISQNIEIFRNRINSTEKELSNLKIQNKGLIKPMMELENIRDKCPVCKSSIDSNKRKELIDDYESQIEFNKNMIIDLNKDLENIKSKISDIDNEAN